MSTTFGDSLDLLRATRAVAVLRTAARIHGVDATPPGRRGRDFRLETLMDKRIGSPPVPGATTYRWTVAPSHVQMWRDIRTTTPLRTASDCARSLPWMDAVAAVDKFLRIGLKRDALGRFIRQTSTRRALRVFELADGGSESTMESWLRCMIHEVGLPRPEVQVGVGAGRFRVDLGYREFRLGVEYDGQWFHAGPRVGRQDLRRRAAIESAGWKLLVFNMRHLLVEPRTMLELILVTLCRRGWRPGSARRDYILRRIASFDGLWSRRRPLWTDLKLDLTGDAPLPAAQW